MRRSGSPGGSSRQARRREAGVAAVEFAILLPLVFLIIAGIVDFGRAFFTQIELTNAAREGARIAVIPGSSAGDIQTRVVAAATGVPGLTVPGPIICATTASPPNAVVAVQAPFSWLLLQPALNIIRAGSALPTNLSATGVMRCGG